MNGRTLAGVGSRLAGSEPESDARVAQGIPGTAFDRVFTGGYETWTGVPVSELIGSGGFHGEVAVDGGPTGSDDFSDVSWFEPLAF